MKLIEIKCCSCGAQIMPEHGTALYICDYCHCVNAVKFLTDDDLLSREERQAAAAERKRQRHAVRFYALLFGGGLLPQLIISFYLSFAMPYAFTRHTLTFSESLMVPINLLLAALSIGAGLYGTVKLYYSCGYNRTLYNCTTAAILGFFAFNMFINKGSLVHGLTMVPENSLGIMSFLFIAEIVTGLCIYPAFRWYVRRNTDRPPTGPVKLPQFLTKPLLTLNGGDTGGMNELIRRRRREEIQEKFDSIMSMKITLPKSRR